MVQQQEIENCLAKQDEETAKAEDNLLDDLAAQMEALQDNSFDLITDEDNSSGTLEISSEDDSSGTLANSS